jgi:ParB family chromosome partitioning protein
MTTSLPARRPRSSTNLDNYEPDVGLKRIAVAEAAEKHYQRAKDATQLLDAVELKLSEQRKFVLWWDGQSKNPGSRRGVAVADQQRPVLGGDGLPDRDTVHRWRARLKAEPAFQATLAKAQARCVKVCEARQGQSDYAKATNTGEVEWYTPPEYLEAAREVLGAFDLDPASSTQAQQRVRAARFFTKEQNGLAHAWPGRVWLNPPYTQPDIAQFVAKLADEISAGRTTAAILLTHNYTDTAWFHRAAGACAAICFTRGRVGFIDSTGVVAAPTQGQAFFYYGGDRDGFVRRFASIGFVVQPC